MPMESVPPESTPRSRSKLILFSVALIVLTILLFVAAAEIFLRSTGEKPWRHLVDNIRVEPNGKFYQTHPTLGYTHIPGSFEVTLRTGYTFTATHSPETWRITHPPEQNRENAEKEGIWIFGCSVTYGWSIDDNETYPWILQERFPEYEVVNYGVSGYGTIHSLIQFREALKKKSPKVAVLAYGGFHDERNTFSRKRRKQVAPYNRLGPLGQPYARFDESGTLQHFIGDVDYAEFPLMRYLTLSHFLEKKYNELELSRLNGGAVSEAIVLEMANLASDHGVRFIVANIGGGRPMVAVAKQKGIPAVNIAVSSRIPENTNLPHDGHPSAVANLKYANRLEKSLRAELAGHGKPAESPALPEKP